MMKPGFTGSPLDRVDHLRGDPAAIAALRARPDALLLRMNALDPVAAAGGALEWVPADAAAGELALLGLIDGIPRFAALDGGGKPMAQNDLWSILFALPAGEAATYAAARSLVDWHRRHGFCARCGAATASIRGGWARSCPACSAEHYPRTDPVAIMLAEHDGAVLVGRQHGWPAGRYSALAGYIEVGESIEGCVARELKEEAGVDVTAVRYLTSQPWPFPSQLMIACIAQVRSRDTRLDEAELESVLWVDRDQVRAAMAGDAGAPFLMPTPLAIAHTLLTAWVDGA